MANQKVASWYWNITAILTPFVLIVTLVWLFYSQEVQSYQVQARRTVEQLQEDKKQLDALVTDMNKVAVRVGFDPGGVMAKKGEATVAQRDTSVGGQERNLPREKQSVVLQHYLDAENLYYGDASSASGFVYEYAAARDWIGRFRTTLERYIAYKSTQGYHVTTVDKMVVAETNLGRPNPNDATVWDKPVAAGQAPTMTLEDIFRRQQQLLQDLMRANKRQYGLLYAEVSGSTESKDPTGLNIWIGAAGETKALERLLGQLRTVQDDIDRRKEAEKAVLEPITRATTNAAQASSGQQQTLERKVVVAGSRIETLQAEFAAEAAQHREDADRFRQMLTRLPKIKAPARQERSEPDGEISYSDFNRGVCHINLGASDGVRQGQRFEVWRMSGHERDEIIGVIEIVRTLSPHYSLATVLSLVDEKNPVRTNDKIVSALWHNGRFFTIAMHGEFEPPAQSYTKERLKELLELAGCKVVEKVQPGVDLVILGSNLFGDEWYREARNDLRFAAMQEDSIRLYVDPR
jgi:hypothetical protein